MGSRVCATGGMSARSGIASGGGQSGFWRVNTRQGIEWITRKRMAILPSIYLRSFANIVIVLWRHPYRPFSPMQATENLLSYVYDQKVSCRRGFTLLSSIADKYVVNLVPKSVTL